MKPLTRCSLLALAALAGSFALRAAVFIEPASGTGFLTGTAAAVPANTTRIDGNLTDSLAGDANPVDLYQVSSLLSKTGSCTLK